jgi:hypothetical protein
MVARSYVSRQVVPGYHSPIPEFVPAVTSVTTRWLGERVNPVGRFIFRHIQPDLFTGYTSKAVSGSVCL